MKKFVFGFVAILALIGLFYGGYKIYGYYKILTKPAIKNDEDIRSAKVAVKCDYKNHSCDYFTPPADGGNLKVTITINAKPGKKIPVLLWKTFNPASDPKDEAYVKYTDENGIAFFEGIPSGAYFPNYNLIGFPKEYGGAYNSWTTSKVEISKGKTAEITLSLTQK